MVRYAADLRLDVDRFHLPRLDGLSGLTRRDFWWRYWIEPVTSSVSGQNLCLGIRGSVVSGACAGSLMFATVRFGRQ